MANASVGGLVSGLDTATIISQLMQLEARPQVNLKTRVSSENRAVSALQTLNSKLANIATKAADLADLTNWSPVKATSSNDKVTVSAGSSAVPTTLTFDVTRTARGSSATYSTSATTDAPDVVTAGQTITVAHDSGETATFNTGDGSLADVVAAINNPDNKTGLQATLVKTGAVDVDDKPLYQLHVTSTRTGDSSGFSLGAGFLGGVATTSSSSTSFATTASSFTSAPTGTATYSISSADGSSAQTLDLSGLTSLANVADAINAQTTGLTADLVDVGGDQRLRITSDSGQSFKVSHTGTNDVLGGTYVGTAGSNASITVNGQAMTSSSNTIAGLMPGVDVTLADGATGSATITIAQDSASLSTKVKSMVDAVNTALAEISSLTASGGAGGTPGMLAGDGTLRTVRNQLLEAVTNGVGGESLASYGIQTDRSGKLVFDEVKFKEAYAANPAATAAKFAEPADPAAPNAVMGIAATFESLADTFSDSIDGTVTSAIKSRQSQIKGWEDDIADWDVRLDARRTALERQYTALESALGKLQSQGNWLAGQLAGLPSWNSGQ